jgi:hypothetical protein
VTSKSTVVGYKKGDDVTGERIGKSSGLGHNDAISKKDRTDTFEKRGGHTSSTEVSKLPKLPGGQAPGSKPKETPPAGREVR